MASRVGAPYLLFLSTCLIMLYLITLHQTPYALVQLGFVAVQVVISVAFYGFHTFPFM